MEESKESDMAQLITVLNEIDNSIATLDNNICDQFAILSDALKELVEIERQK
jgi:hypothetical protein